MVPFTQFNRLRRVPPATVEKAILQAAKSACTGLGKMWFLCKTSFRCITRFLCTASCVNHLRKTSLCKPRFKFKPEHECINQGLGKRPCIERWRMWQTTYMNEHKKRHNKPVANTAKRAEKTREITATCSKHVKTKRVLSESWAELSPAQRGKRWRQKARRGQWRRRWRGEEGGLKLDEAKIRAKGKV